MKLALKRFTFIFAFFMVVIVQPVFAGPRTGYTNPVATYKAGEGFVIESYSDAWETELKLKAVYNELMKNTIGEEINHLKAIYLYPDIDEGVHGYYNSVVNNDSKGNYSTTEENYIVLLGCDEFITLSELSYVLSHEYGHHFTIYHMVNHEKKYGIGFLDTEYAELRGLSAYKDKILASQDNFEHKWDIFEILAEDYMQLFASKTSKQSIDYLDVKERVELDAGDFEYRNLGFNSRPQENLDIPLVTNYPKVKDYFEKISGVSNKAVISSPKSVSLNLKNKYLLLGTHKGFELEVKGAEAYPNYEFTIIMHPVNNSSNIIPVKTIKSGRSFDAYIGSYKQDDVMSSKAVIETYKGKYSVRLFAKSESGYIYELSSLILDFDEDIQTVIETNSTKAFNDLKTTHWAYEYIISLTQRGIITGYSDGSFKAENNIRKSEFVALLFRTTDVDLSKYKKISDDWFIREGYDLAMKDYVLITEADYGKGYTKFDGNSYITRGEMAYMIGRILMSSKYSVDINTDYTKDFKDTIDDKYKKELNISMKYEILSGYEDGTFRSKNNTTRGEASKIIYKMLKLASTSR